MSILADPRQGVSSRDLNLFFALSNQRGLYAMSILADPPQGASSRDLNLFFALSNQICPITRAFPSQLNSSEGVSHWPFLPACLRHTTCFEFQVMFLKHGRVKD